MTRHRYDPDADLGRSLARQARQLPFPLDTARLDQHLLVSVEAVRQLVDSADVQPDEVVADVGSGLGILSVELAKRARTVVSVEIDGRFEPTLRRLQERLPNVRVQIGDFLGSDWAGLDKIVANPAFGLLEPLLKRATLEAGIRLIALLLGRSSAEVLTARPGQPKFTRLSLVAQAYFEVSIEATVPPAAFYPPPRTAASVVLLRRLRQPSSEGRILRLLARAATFKAGSRVRDVAATLHARAPRPRAERILAEQLSNPEIWNWRLQRLSNEQLSALVADLVRLSAARNVGSPEPLPADPERNSF